MINWCPIGRSANQKQRAFFEKIDNEDNLRGTYIKKLKNDIEKNDIGVTVKLGGDTSFDIYPTGWDKTFALRHFDNPDWNFWFVGDRCYPNGNDYEIFTHLAHTGRAFETSGPAETLEIIDFYILRDLL